jgi:hypothetical protein
VVKIPDLAKRANKVLRGRKVLLDRRVLRGRRVPVAQQQVMVRLSASSMWGARHPHA